MEEVVPLPKSHAQLVIPPVAVDELKSEKSMQSPSQIETFDAEKLAVGGSVLQTVTSIAIPMESTRVKVASVYTKVIQYEPEVG